MPWLTKTDANRRLGFILERRSIRVYAPGQVSEEQVQSLLAAAMAAPSAAGMNPWHFVVVRKRETLERMAEALPHGEILAGASLAITVCGDLDRAHDNQISYLLQDCAAAIQNLLLAAHIVGLGACWLGVHPRLERVKSIKDILLLPLSVIPVACISLGYPGESKEPHAEFYSDRVHSENW